MIFDVLDHAGGKVSLSDGAASQSPCRIRADTVHGRTSFMDALRDDAGYQPPGGAEVPSGAPRPPAAVISVYRDKNRWALQQGEALLISTPGTTLAGQTATCPSQKKLAGLWSSTRVRAGWNWGECPGAISGLPDFHPVCAILREACECVSRRAGGLVRMRQGTGKGEAIDQYTAELAAA